MTATTAIREWITYQASDLDVFSNDPLLSDGRNVNNS
jgi:hypothetical protein